MKTACIGELKILYLMLSIKLTGMHFYKSPAATVLTVRWTGTSISPYEFQFVSSFDTEKIYNNTNAFHCLYKNNSAYQYWSKPGLILKGIIKYHIVA